MAVRNHIRPHKKIAGNRIADSLVFILIFGVTIFLNGCLRKMAINTVANALASSGTTYASDEDPELVGDAVPFALKLYESMLEETPKHKGLLLATSSGFTQYSYVYVQFKAEMKEESDFSASREMKKRAKRLYLRARDYAIRGIELGHPDFLTRLRANHQESLIPMKKKDVPFLYWLGASWAAAISIAKDDLDLLSDLYLVEAIMNKALKLDADFSDGVIHEFFIAFDSRSVAMGGDIKRAREHFARTVELTQGKKASPYVSLAENVSVQEQNVKEYKKLLQSALAIDVDSEPLLRLENVIAQRKANWLLSQIDNLFLIIDEEPDSVPQP